MKMPNQQSEIIQRLRCASGHLNSVIEMTEEGKPCEHILHQLNAVRAALIAVGLRMIICQVQASQAIMQDSSSVEERVAGLKRIQSLYTVFTQHPNYHNEVSHDEYSF